MTFIGLSVSDFVTVPTFGWKIYKRCRDGPQEFLNISESVGSLYIVLRETQEYLIDIELSEHKWAKLTKITNSCQATLEKVDSLLAKYGTQGRLGSGVWKRIKWADQDLAGIKSELTFCVALMTSFNNTLISLSQSQVEKTVKKLLGRSHRSKTLSGLPLQQLGLENGKGDSWIKFCEYLKESGISMRRASQHQSLILDCIRDSLKDEDKPASLAPASIADSRTTPDLTDDSATEDEDAESINEARTPVDTAFFAPKPSKPLSVIAEELEVSVREDLRTLSVHLDPVEEKPLRSSFTDRSLGLEKPHSSRLSAERAIKRAGLIIPVPKSTLSTISTMITDEFEKFKNPSKASVLTCLAAFAELSGPSDNAYLSNVSPFELDILSSILDSSPMKDSIPRIFKALVLCLNFIPRSPNSNEGSNPSLSDIEAENELLLLASLSTIAGAMQSIPLFITRLDRYQSTAEPSQRQSALTVSVLKVVQDFEEALRKVHGSLSKADPQVSLPPPTPPAGSCVEALKELEKIAFDILLESESRSSSSLSSYLDESPTIPSDDQPLLLHKKTGSISKSEPPTYHRLHPIQLKLTKSYSEPITPTEQRAINTSYRPYAAALHTIGMRSAQASLLRSWSGPGSLLCGPSTLSPSQVLRARPMVV